ncbi:LacI family transcriptional regulator [Labedella gwakjiensis]|uniref:LacI family DNA-binding transcriptional regulator n=1 Tax=Labedella gwakjiensis TaxID=390269 RepID=A0A2P8GXL1_9MICO|nr:LacI family DNA-binding transcriptional regulator [Labedella gwakjiensis]PSL38697.1 LacI family transcriptional regulator [Labedella gwakjiensis]RUQ86809.1 LacI family DNA-binding transcriptional regulator [Labedella gwakjiensis]
MGHDAVNAKPRRSRRAPSMLDVAKHANVSTQTVSRVSNGLTNVDENTRARVIESMQELGYRPNGAARALKSGRFHSIGVITFTLATVGNMRTLEGITTRAAAADYTVTLISIPPTVDAVSGAYSRLTAQAVDGVVIVFEARLLDEGVITLPPGLPVVVVDSNGGPEHPVIDTDQFDGASRATEHLLDLGHETVWHIAGPADSFSAVHRLAAWQETLERHGRRVPPVIHGAWTTMSGYEAGRELAARDDVTAVFAANDQMALGLLRALHEAGRDVPGEVSVVGFDDIDEAQGFWPPLTSVHQDFAAVGSAAVDSLLERIDGGAVRDRVTLVQTELVVRSSTAPPPVR